MLIYSSLRGQREEIPRGFHTIPRSHHIIPAHMSYPSCTAPGDPLICLQINAALPITDSDPSQESAAFFQQVNDFLKSVKVEEPQLFSFGLGLEPDAVANSGSKLRVLQYRCLNLFWDTTRHYRRDYKTYVLRLSSTLKASQPSPSPVLS
jgi:hypothetical protein